MKIEKLEMDIFDMRVLRDKINEIVDKLNLLDVDVTVSPTMSSNLPFPSHCQHVWEPVVGISSAMERCIKCGTLRPAQYSGPITTINNN